MVVEVIFARGVVAGLGAVSATSYGAASLFAVLSLSLGQRWESLCCAFADLDGRLERLGDRPPALRCGDAFVWAGLTTITGESNLADPDKTT